MGLRTARIGATAQRWARRWALLACALACGAALGLLLGAAPVAAAARPTAPEQEATTAAVSAATILQQVVITGPVGSVHFGRDATVLPNGNFVVTDLDFNDGSGRAGMVYLYNGVTHALISALRVNPVGDTIYSAIVRVLADGNFVVINYLWNSATATDVGAVRWCSAETGCTGAMTAANALVGSSAGDNVGFNGITALPNGAFVVASRKWHNGVIADAGAVTWCAAGGCVGAVSTANSLVGASAADAVGMGVVVLESGNFVVFSPDWDDGALVNAGGVTWCSGATGCPAAISAANSLVGNHADDKVGYYGVTPLRQGRYLVRTPNWDRGAIANAGAVTFCAGIGGCAGVIAAGNSLVGVQANDYVGNGQVVRLVNGGYVVSSILWHNGATAGAGAATFCTAASPCVGDVTAANSLVGSTTSDNVGYSLKALTNGHYVVISSNWDNGATDDVGAVTWCDGTTGCTGVVMPANSLIGSVTDDTVGGFGNVTVLSNSDYVVGSYNWDNGAVTGAGALTLCSGSGGCVGTVTPANSLVGTQTNDRLGFVQPLNNGGYVVMANSWDDGATVDVGLVIQCPATGCTGVVNSANGLKGSHMEDFVGEITLLSTGNYLIVSPNWDNGALAEAGAITWCSVAQPCTGTVSAANSLMGSQANASLGSPSVEALANGRVLIHSANWTDGVREQLGAVTLLDARHPLTGSVSAANSVLGNSEGEGSNIYPVFNPVHNYAVVGLPFDNRVVLAALTYALHVDLAGTGSGAVQSSPAGLTCAANPCQAAFADSIVVTLTATTNANSTFTGWSSACSSNPCVVTMDDARTVQATFTLKSYALTVSKTGDGQGTVSSAAGIACGADCSETLAHGTAVVLTATPATGSTFTGWAGACTGMGACNVVIDAPRAVTATFAVQQVQVTIAANVPGGHIDVNPVAAANAARTAAAAAIYPYGTLLRFNAVPNAGFGFVAWAGDLNGSQNPLEHTLTGPLNVSATFVALPQAGGAIKVYLPTVTR